MTHQARRRRTTVAAALLLQITLGLPALAQQGRSTATSANADILYRKAEKELRPEIYVIYRIIDRLARANGQDSLPWRVVMSTKYEVNAFASDRNLIAIYAGLLDQIYGDTSALACVVGHEMGHHVARHVSTQMAYEAMTTGIADKELQEQIRSRVAKAQVSDFFSGIVQRVIGFRIPGLSSGFDPERIKKEKEKELQAKLAEFSRLQEFEADEIGYRFMATAGYDPQGCIRVMDVLARGDSSEFDTTHPVVRKRIEQLQRLMKEAPPSSLASNGRSLLASTPPLTYNKSLDGASLRVNSRFASAAGGRQGSTWIH